MVTDAGAFCCRGCEAVFTALTSSGLGDYYQCAVTPGVSQRGAGVRDAARFAALDDPAVAARFFEFNDGALARATFTVPAMHCASCLWLLERVWRVNDAITRADVDLMRRSVRVTFRPDRVSLRGVAEVLASIGYEPALDGERLPGRMPDARRRLYMKIGVAGFAFGNIMLFSIPRYANGAPLDGGFQRLFDTLNVLFATPVLLYSASDYFRSAWHAITRRTMSLDVPVALGLAVLYVRSIADIASGHTEGFLDSFTGLVFLLLVGRLFQQKAFDAIAFDRTFRSFFPLSVRREQADGASAMVPLERVTVGDRLIVRPQEIVPADAVLLDETGAIDYAFITGEERPVSLTRGDTVRAGGRAVMRALRVEVARDVSHSQLAGLWNNPVFAREKSDWLSVLSARFGAWFTVIAVGLAAAGAIAWWPDGRMAIQVATAVLIIACPCAFTLAAPITLGTAMGVLGRRGWYLKNPAVALALSRIDTVVFDKTGTLTSPALGARLDVVGLSETDARLARRLAAESIHPVSRALAATGAVTGQVTHVEEVPGAGIRGDVDGHRVVLGTARFMAMEAGTVASVDEARTGVAIDGRLRGWLSLVAPIRSGVEGVVRALSGSVDTWLVSGDHATEAPRWRAAFGDRMHFRQSPDDKLARVRAHQHTGRHVLMVGDGLNDAGALSAADVGLAISDDTACVVPSCDIVAAGDRLRELPWLLAYGRRARQVIVLCLLVSIFYNVIGLSLALAGWLTPLITAIFMPVSSLTIIGLSAGLMRWYGREGARA